MTSTDLDLLVSMRHSVRSGLARACREQAGLSRRELATSLDVALSTVTKWELGQRVPQGEPALRYARVLAHLEARAGAAQAR